jgi:hypothetical protein
MAAKKRESQKGISIFAPFVLFRGYSGSVSFSGCQASNGSSQVKVAKPGKNIGKCMQTLQNKILTCFSNQSQSGSVKASQTDLAGLERPKSC